jgi:hypothetical protein
VTVQCFFSSTLCSPPGQLVEKYFNGPYYEWWDRQGEEYIGSDLSVHVVAQYEQEHGPFDGIIGFSQGGCLTAMLTALNQEQAGKLFPHLKFAVILSGFFPRVPAFRALHPDPVPLPVMSIYGESDFLKEDCLQLSNHFSNLTVAQHSGGHEPPTKNNGEGALLQLNQFLNQFLA